jgi:DNA-directed RNA polymerase subunit RPC12/RpoP
MSFKKFGDSYAQIYKCSFCEKTIESCKKYKPQEIKDRFPRCPFCAVKQSLSGHHKFIIHDQIERER